jgi:DNA-binding GntR family transcriptional regulator
MIKDSVNNLVSQVYDYVLNMILTRQIKCGERIPETMIAEKLNISRTPIREALRLLANAGIIKIYPKRFAEVISFSDQDVKDLGFVRIMLDTLAAQLAIINGSNADFAKLKGITDRCLHEEEDGDIVKSVNLDCDFHMMLATIAGNPFLVDMQKDLYLKVKLLLCTTDRQREDRIESLMHHYEIIEKLVKRDSAGVIKAIYEHLAHFYRLDLEKYKTFHFNIEDIVRLSK